MSGEWDFEDDIPETAEKVRQSPKRLNQKDVPKIKDLKVQNEDETYSAECPSGCGFRVRSCFNYYGLMKTLHRHLRFSHR